MEALEYQDSDFIYVDPETRTVVGKVEWDANGFPKSKKKVFVEKLDKDGNKLLGKDGKERRKPRERNYPWGTFKSMCAMFKLKGKGKDKETDDYIQLEEAISKSMEQPYWD